MKFVLKSQLLKDEFALDSDYSQKNLDLPIPEASALLTREGVPEDRMIFQILIGYASSLDDIANDEDVNLDLDLTYNTVKNLPLVIAYGFKCWADCTTAERVDISAKSLAAYLTLLCENEHQCGIELIKPFLYNEKIINYGWCGNIFRTGVKEKKDLLGIAKESVRYADSSLIIEDEAIRQAYREMTGVELSEYGYDGLTAVF